MGGAKSGIQWWEKMMMGNSIIVVRSVLMRVWII